MQGTRLPDAVLGEPGPGWEQWGGKTDSPRQAPPGAYMKVSTAWEGDPGRIIWYIKDPLGRMGSLGDKHTVVEHDDGTITVSPSILSTAEQGGYHGFLQRGVWTSA